MFMWLSRQYRFTPVSSNENADGIVSACAFTVVSNTGFVLLSAPGEGTRCSTTV